MSDALPQKENATQTGEPNGQAGLTQADVSEVQSEPPQESQPESQLEPPLEPLQESQPESQLEPQPEPQLEPQQEPQPEPQTVGRRSSARNIAIKVVLVVMIVSVFGFLSFGFGETPYTSRHWLTTIATGGGLLPKFFSSSPGLVIRAASFALRGNFESTKGDYPEAEKSFARALTAIESLKAVDTVVGHYCLSGLGKAQNEQKHEGEAENALKRAVEAAKAAYGEEHETVAIAYRELAFSLARQRKLDEAQAAYKQALQLDTKGYGPEHFEVAYDMSCVGEMALFDKRYPEAIKYLKDSIDIYRKVRGEFHPSFLWVEESLGKAYYESKSYKEAARQFESILANTDRLHGTPGKDYFRDLAWLGWSYYHDMNLERARIRANKLRELIEKRSDSALLPMIDVVESNGDLFMMLGEHATAIPVFERVLKLQEAKLGKNEPSLRTILLYLSQCCEKAGRVEDAKRYSARADELLREFP